MMGDFLSAWRIATVDHANVFPPIHRMPEMIDQMKD